MRQKVIIDTDLGGDIDDAFALCLALKSPEIEVLGVTTVFQDTVKRAKMVKALLTAANVKDIPVYAGEGAPINNPEMFGRKNDFNEAPWGYSPKYDKYEIDGKDGVNYIIRTLEETKEPVTIITLGALTNIAGVLKNRPDLYPKIKKLSVMGGAFSINHQEYNFTCDPEAADFVLNCGVLVDCVGVDITFKCFPSDEQLKMLSENKSDCIKLLIEMRGKWKHKIFFHDPLAVMCAFDDSFVEFKKLCCRVETKGEFTRGHVADLSDYNWQKDAKNSKLRAGFEVKSEEFVKKCMERLLSY